MIRDHHPTTRAHSDMLRAANESAPLITRAEVLAALAELSVAPTPCPSCGGAMGDGDRVSRGVCAMCTRRGRRAGDR